jgi:hypothetical protein
LLRPARGVLDRRCRWAEVGCYIPALSWCLRRRDCLPDGQIAHGRYAQIARRAIVPQAVAIARNPKSPASSRLSHPSEGRLENVTDAGWDAMDAIATQDERR